jgi:hypothetical protein
MEFIMKKISTILIALLALLISACDEGSPISIGGSKNKIESGEKVELGSQSAGKSGGILKFTKPGDQLDGLTINVPDSSYNESRTFEVSYTTIKSHNFGEFFNPISPMITISNGGGYASKVMTVEVPVTIPKGCFAMGFLYNEVTGELEGMPLLEIKDKSVVVGTRHFATSSITGKKQKISIKNRDKLLDNIVIGNIIISAVYIEILKSQTDIISDFEPTYDDWEFLNKGTILSPGGIFSGMTLSAMWYYISEEPWGIYKLYHRYDKYTIANYAKLWQDNTLGIKLSSVVQVDYDASNATYGDEMKAFAMDKTKDSLSWYAFAYTILQTKQPQLIGIYSSTGGDHALIASEVWMQDGKLWISDPNHPGNRDLYILYTNNEFEPYQAAYYVDEIPKEYEYIAYLGKTAIVDWSQLSQRWEELNNGTIGKDIFPDINPWIYDSTGIAEDIELTDEFKSVADTLFLKIKDNSSHEYAFTIYDFEGYSILPNPDAKSEWVFDGKIILKPGLNIFGFCLGQRIVRNGENQWVWANFKWIDVYYESTSIISLQSDKSPLATPGNVDQNYVFSVKLPQDLVLKNPLYTWNFGDGTNIETRYNDTCSHKYIIPRDSSYFITLKITDNGKPDIIIKNTAKIMVSLIPLKIGNTWFATDKYDTNGVFKSSMEGAYKIIKDSLFKGKKWAVMDEYELVTGPGTNGALVRNDTDGIHIMDEMRNGDLLNTLWFKYPCKAGDEFANFSSTYNDLGDIETDDYVTKVISINESVTVPAGTFKCIHYQQIHNYTSSSNSFSQHIIDTYISFGVGFIKIIDDNKWNNSDGVKHNNTDTYTLNKVELK